MVGRLDCGVQASLFKLVKEAAEIGERALIPEILFLDLHSITV